MKVLLYFLILVGVVDIEKEALRFSDFNLRIGYPSSLEIEAGCIQEKFLEVYHPNSIIYVGYATASNDINFELLLYQSIETVSSMSERVNPPQRSDTSKTLVSRNHVVSTETNFMSEDADPDQANFKRIIKIDRIDSSLNPVKIVLFVSEPGTYKIVWDNSFSWFTSKSLRYRFSVLKPLSQLDLNRKVDFEVLRSKSSISLNNIGDKQVNQSINSNAESKKLLMVKYEGKNISFLLNEIEKKESAMRNNKFYHSIAVVLTRNLIRIFNIDKKEVLCYEFKSLEEEEKSFSEFFENKLNCYIEKVI